jgi:hypothetical protein
MPLEQTRPAAHAVPQAPQWFRSVSRSRQTPEHAVVPAPHETRQLLDEHTWPLGQVMPHMPQLARSESRSRHTPEQFVVPAPQLTVQAPREQT